MLIDTHCHLDMIVKEKFNTPLTQPDTEKISHILEEAADASVQRIITIGTNTVENNNSVALANKFDSVFASVGLHPNDSTIDWKDDLAVIKKLLVNKKVVAIGECGLDYHWPNFDKDLQHDVFKAQIELALEHNLALVIHTRDAYDETMRILEPYQNSITKLVMHCFSENMTAAQEIISRGYLLGIGGIITYPKNNELRNIVKTFGPEHIVLETDAPFLPPQIIRGKTNHPKYVAVIAHYIAQLLERPYADIERITTENAHRLFPIQKY